MAEGRCPPDPPVFGWGGQSPPRPPPLNGRPQHLIEAAKRGRLDQMIFCSAPLTTRAPPGRPAGRSSAAHVSSAAPKKNSFDRGGPVWPPRSNVTNNRLRGVWRGFAPPAKNRGVWGGSAPQRKVNQKVYRRHLCYKSFNRVQNINAQMLLACLL